MTSGITKSKRHATHLPVPCPMSHAVQPCTVFPLCNHRPDYVISPLFATSSLVAILSLRHHPRQHNHINQKHRPHNPKGKHRLPTLANTPLLQPRQGIDTEIFRRLVEDEGLALGIYVTGGSKELDRGFDQAGEVEDEEDEGADYHYTGQEATLDDEDEHEEDEDYG